MLGAIFVVQAAALCRSYSDRLPDATFRCWIVCLALLFAALLLDHYMKTHMKMLVVGTVLLGAAARAFQRDRRELASAQVRPTREGLAAFAPRFLRERDGAIAPVTRSGTKRSERFGRNIDVSRTT